MLFPTSVLHLRQVQWSKRITISKEWVCFENWNVLCVLHFLFLIRFSSHLHSIFYDFDYGSFSFFVCFFVVWFLGQTVVTTAVLKVTTLCLCKGCNNRIHRVVLKNKVPKCIIFLRNPKKPNIQYQSGILKYFLGFLLENKRRNYRRTKPT